MTSKTNIPLTQESFEEEEEENMKDFFVNYIICSNETSSFLRVGLVSRKNNPGKNSDFILATILFDEDGIIGQDQLSEEQELKYNEVMAFLGISDNPLCLGGFTRTPNQRKNT